jgi:opacity protein-like surface antigen
MRFFSCKTVIFYFSSLLITCLYAENREGTHVKKTNHSIYCGLTFGPASYNGHYCTQEGVNTNFFQAGGLYGFLGGNVGIDTHLNPIYLALEASAVGANSNDMIGLFTNKVSIPEHVIFLKSQFMTDGALKVGMESNNIILYGLIGVAGGKFSTIICNDSAKSWCKGVQPNAELKFSRFVWGKQFGGGVRFPFYYDWLIVDLQYSYNNYNDMRLNLYELSSQLTWVHNINVNNSIFKISLDVPLYKF